MSFTIPRRRGSSPLLRILKTNLTIRPRLPVTGSGLCIKNFPFSSHAVLTRPRTASSTNQGNLNVSRRLGSVDSVTNMHRQCMRGIRLSSTVEEAGMEKEGVKQGQGGDEAVKAEEAEKEMDVESVEEVAEETEKEAGKEMDEKPIGELTEYTEEEAEIDWDKDVPEETEEEYKARFPATHDITVKRKTGPRGKHAVVEEHFFKAYLTLQGRKQRGRKPRVWVSFSEEIVPPDVAGLQWPKGREGVTKATVFDWEEGRHDGRCKWPLGKGMEFRVLEKGVGEGERRIWREVVQKGEGE